MEVDAYNRLNNVDSVILPDEVILPDVIKSGLALLVYFSVSTKVLLTVAAFAVCLKLLL